MPTNNLIEFVLYVIPGFLAVEIYRATYPAKERSEFNQIGWSILVGLFIVSFVKWIDNKFCSNVLNSNSPGLPGLRFTCALILCGVLVGLFWIYIHYGRFVLSQKFKLLNKIAPDPQTIWAKINQSTNENWCVVFLDNGSIYMGYISQFTYDPERESYDFLLGKAKRVNEELEEKYIIDGIGVYLNTKDVKRIEFLKGR